MVKTLAVLLVALGVSGQTPTPRMPSLDARAFQYIRVNGSATASVTGNLSAAGSGKVLTFSACPAGLNTLAYVYISGGTGTAESARITATTCTIPGGAAGTITITTANTHSGSWSVQSDSGGIAEAAATLPSNGGTVSIAPGTTLTGGHSGVIVTATNAVLQGTGWGSILKARDNAAMDSVMVVGDHGIQLRDFRIDGNRSNNGTNTANGAALTLNSSQSIASGMELTAAAKFGIVISDPGLSNITIEDNYIHDNGGTVLGGEGYGINATSNTPRTSRMRIIHNRIENNYNTVTSANASGAMCLDADHVEILSNVILNNYNNTGGQIAVCGTAGTQNVGWRINSNQIYLTGVAPVTQSTSGIEMNGSGFVITGNNISGNTQSGVVVESSGAALVGDGTISGNTLEANAVGVWLFCSGCTTGYVRAVTISGNRISGSDPAILATQPAHTLDIAIGHNDLNDNATTISGVASFPGIEIIGNNPGSVANTLAGDLTVGGHGTFGLLTVSNPSNPQIVATSSVHTTIELQSTDTGGRTWILTSIGSLAARTGHFEIVDFGGAGVMMYLDATTAGAVFSASLLPSASSTYGIGSPSAKWLGGYFIGEVSSTNGFTTETSYAFCDAGSTVCGNMFYNAGTSQTEIYSPTTGGTTGMLVMNGFTHAGAFNGGFHPGVNAAYDLGLPVVLQWRTLYLSSGLIVGGNTGTSHTYTMNTGAGTCTIITTGGAVTGGTC